MDRKIKISIIMILLIGIIVALAFYFENNHKKIKLKNVEVVNEDILVIDEEDRKECINGLIKYLNKEHYYKCKKIKFYLNTYSLETSDKYFYALVIGADKSLIEIHNLGNGNFKYKYIGNQMNPNTVSPDTDVTYLQIIDPEKYELQNKLTEIRENGENALPDGTENKTIDPNDGYTIE
ncbi:MAG: hypothetical protein E7160_01300 [Firmicutes bacterium]|nr:hypothetical protein [Bacillota bacterium]